MHLRVYRLALIVVLSWVVGCQGEATNGVSPAAHRPTRQIRVAAAADLRYAFDEIAAAFAAEHADITIKPTYGSSGNFFAQLSNHAPFDIFLSADISYPRKLIDEGLAVKDSEFVYAVGYIVVWARNDSPLEVEHGLQTLLDPKVRKIAIANPEHAPYGRAAVAAMKATGIYDQVSDKLVLGENISQAAQFIETSAADIGVIALSLALSPTMNEKGRYWLVPADSYPVLEQGGAILNWAEDAAAARLLRDYLQSAPGKAVLKRYGFGVPGE